MSRPAVVVFFGGSPSNHDLSMESGAWVCRYLPRARYQVTPVRVTPDGAWQVPLGTLPQQGAIDGVLERLWQAVPAVAAAAGLERLMAKQPRVWLTLLRGHGGDDGALQSLGAMLGVPVVGSSAQTCYETADKQRLLRRLDGIVATPRTERYRAGKPIDEAVMQARQIFRGMFFMKPAQEEGSVGATELAGMAALPPALARLAAGEEVVLQEHVPGMEVTITLIGDGTGNIQTLPPAIIQTERAPFYDALAKRRAGRAKITISDGQSEASLKKAVEAARTVYAELGCRGWVTFDFKITGDSVTLLEVNSIPTFSAYTPLVRQLQAARISPAAWLQARVDERLTNG